MKKQAKRFLSVFLAMMMLLSAIPVVSGFAAGDSMYDATSISIGSTYYGSITDYNEKDYYKITVNSSGRLTFNATAKMEYISYSIYTEDGECLWDDYPYWSSNTEKSNINIYLDLTKGAYYLLVSKYSGYTGNYSFKFSFAGAGESFTETGWGTNNSMSSANTVSLNKTYNGQLADNDEKDFYKFVLPSSGKLTFTATAKMKYISYSIYTEDGECLWDDYPYWSSNTEKSNINIYLDLTKGTYYLLVSKYSGYTGNYSFKLSTHTHKYVDVVTKATVSQDGAIVRRCSCGLIKSSSTIPKISSVKLSKTSFTYNGKVQRPSVTVKNSNGTKLNEGKDYTVKYSKGCKDVGQYTVTITFKGRYSGTKKLTFKIIPKGTSISKLSSGKKQFTAKWSKQTAQTTGYELQYSTKSSMSGAKTVTVGKNKTTSSTVKKLKSGKKYYVRVRTYKTVKVNGKSVKLYSSWSKVKSVKTK